MSVDRQIKISKFLSKHLRHEPERLGLILESGGWVLVADLLTACDRAQFGLTLEELKTVVQQSDKQRFSFDLTGLKIRANQGHSVEVDLQLEPQIPPEFLYHGTPEKFLDLIFQEGLCKMSRHHVHLSLDVETAQKVGIRRGKPVILTVNAAKMQADGFVFYRSENGVWLTDRVPPEYLHQKST